VNDDRPWFLVIPLGEPVLSGVPIMGPVHGKIVQAKDEDEAAKTVTNEGLGHTAAVVPLTVLSAVSEAAEGGKA
jgi:hypothetical protein